MDTVAARDWRETRRREHPDCVVCGSERDDGLGLAFAADGAGGVHGTFACGAHWEGYPGLVHGGIVSSLLDGAMTNCLFAAGTVALTAELTVRYLEPLRLGREARISARIVLSRARLQILEAEVEQDGVVRAKARGTFLRPCGAAAV